MSGDEILKVFTGYPEFDYWLRVLNCFFACVYLRSRPWEVARTVVAQVSHERHVVVAHGEGVQAVKGRGDKGESRDDRELRGQRQTGCHGK